MGDFSALNARLDQVIQSTRVSLNKHASAATKDSAVLRSSPSAMARGSPSVHGVDDSVFWWRLSNGTIGGDVAKWPIEAVQEWLEELQLPQYKDAFYEAAVDGAVLLALDEADLDETLGIEHPIHRRKIVLSIERLDTMRPVRRRKKGKIGGGSAHRRRGGRGRGRAPRRGRPIPAPSADSLRTTLRQLVESELNLRGLPAAAAAQAGMIAATAVAADAISDTSLVGAAATGPFLGLHGGHVSLRQRSEGEATNLVHSMHDSRWLREGSTDYAHTIAVGQSLCMGLQAGFGEFWTAAPNCDHRTLTAVWDDQNGRLIVTALKPGKARIVLQRMKQLSHRRAAASSRSPRGSRSGSRSGSGSGSDSDGSGGGDGDVAQAVGYERTLDLRVRPNGTSSMTGIVPLREVDGVAVSVSVFLKAEFSAAVEKTAGGRTTRAGVQLRDASGGRLREVATGREIIRCITRLRGSADGERIKLHLKELEGNHWAKCDISFSEFTRLHQHVCLCAVGLKHAPYVSDDLIESGGGSDSRSRSGSGSGSDSGDGGRTQRRRGRGRNADQFPREVKIKDRMGRSSGGGQLRRSRRSRRRRAKPSSSHKSRASRGADADHRLSDSGTSIGRSTGGRNVVSNETRSINLANAIMTLADVDANGELTFRELQYFSRWHKAFLTFVRGRWRKYARGNADCLDSERLEHAFSRFMERQPKYQNGNRAAQAMVQLIDDDQDGEVSLEELSQHHAEFTRFIAWMKEHERWGRFDRDSDRAINRSKLARAVEEFIGGRIDDTVPGNSRESGGSDGGGALHSDNGSDGGGGTSRDLAASSAGESEGRDHGARRIILVPEMEVEVIFEDNRAASSRSSNSSWKDAVVTEQFDDGSCDVVEDSFQPKQGSPAAPRSATIKASNLLSSLGGKLSDRGREIGRLRPRTDILVEGEPVFIWLEDEQGWFPAHIDAVQTRGRVTTYHLFFDDGSDSDMMGVPRMYIRRDHDAARGGGAEQRQGGHDSGGGAFDFLKGMQVEAQIASGRGGTWCPAYVSKVNVSDSTCDLAMDMTFAVGDAVEGRFEGRDKWFAGKITAVNSDGTFGIRYEDGDSERAVRADHIRSVGGGSSNGRDRSMETRIANKRIRARRQNIAAGTRVEFIDVGGTEWNVATVARVHGDDHGGGGQVTYDIEVDYSDGGDLQEVAGVPRLHVRTITDWSEGGGGGGSRSRRGSRSSHGSRRGSRRGSRSGTSESHLAAGMHVRARHPAKSSSDKEDCIIVYENGGETYNLEFANHTKALFVSSGDIKVPAKSSSALKEKEKCECYVQKSGSSGGAGAWSKGTVKRVHSNGTISVLLSSGEVQAGVAAHFARPLSESTPSAAQPQVGMEVALLKVDGAKESQGFITRVHSSGLCDVQYASESDARRSVKKMKLRMDRLVIGMEVEALVHRDGDRSLGKKGTLEWTPASVEMVHGGGATGTKRNYDVRLVKSGSVSSHQRREYLRLKYTTSLEKGIDVEVLDREANRWSHGVVLRMNPNDSSRYQIELDGGAKKKGVKRECIRHAGDRNAFRAGMVVKALPADHDDTWHQSEMERATVTKKNSDGTFDIRFISADRERRRVRPGEMKHYPLSRDDAVDVYCKRDREWGWLPGTIDEIPPRGDDRKGYGVKLKDRSISPLSAVPRSRIRMKTKDRSRDRDSSRDRDRSKRRSNRSRSRSRSRRRRSRSRRCSMPTPREVARPSIAAA